jgi:hypothetical protein
LFVTKKQLQKNANQDLLGVVKTIAGYQVEVPSDFGGDAGVFEGIHKKIDPAIISSRIQGIAQ